MSDSETFSFLEHVETCPSCFDELNIQFLVKVGLSANSDIDEINLSEDIKAKKLEARRRVNSEKTIRNMFAVLMCMVFILFLGAAILIII